MYLDTAYIAKYYLPEPDSQRVRKVVREAEALISSVISLGEMACVLHRQMRDGNMTRAEVHLVLDTFFRHVDAGLWTLIPINEGLLRQASLFVTTAPENTFLRAGDAIHLTTARNAGESEIWTNDRHLLAAAPHFGLTGRTA